MKKSKPIPQCVLDAIEAMLLPYGTTLDDVSTYNSKKYMTTKQASIYSGLGQKTIRERALENCFDSLRLGTTSRSRVLIDKLSFDQWLNGFKHKPIQHPEVFNA